LEVDVENVGCSTAQLPVDHAARIPCSVRTAQVWGTMPRSRIRWISPSRSSDMRTESMCAPTPAASSSTRSVESAGAPGGTRAHHRWSGLDRRVDQPTGPGGIVDGEGIAAQRGGTQQLLLGAGGPQVERGTQLTRPLDVALAGVGDAHPHVGDLDLGDRVPELW